MGGEMNKARLVKREEISQQKTAVQPAPPKPDQAQLKKVAQEKKQTGRLTSATARAAFAALFIAS